MSQLAVLPRHVGEKNYSLSQFGNLPNPFPLVDAHFQKAASLPRAAVTKTDVFREFQTGIRRLDANRALIQGMLDQAHRCAGFDGHLKGFEARPGVLTDFKLASRPAGEVRAIVQDDLRAMAGELAAGFRGSVELLLREGRLGLAHRSEADETVFEFYYPRVVSKKQTKKDERGRSFERAERWREVHHHSLIEGEMVPWPAKGLRLPDRVAPVLSAVPEFLRESAYVLTGRQISERVFRGLESEGEWQDVTPPARTVYRFDPAILVGPIVLAGWLDGEVADEDRAKIATAEAEAEKRGRAEEERRRAESEDRRKMQEELRYARARVKNECTCYRCGGTESLNAAKKILRERGTFWERLRWA